MPLTGSSVMIQRLSAGDRKAHCAWLFIPIPSGGVLVTCPSVVALSVRADLDTFCRAQLPSSANAARPTGIALAARSDSAAHHVINPAPANGSVQRPARRMLALTGSSRGFALFLP